jgi:YHS domain-containing protein
MQRFILIIFFFSSILSFAQEREARVKNFNLEKGLALDGFDPVSYFNGEPKEGRKEFQASFKGVTYYFLNAANKAKFESAPDKYEPMYGGWCAYAMGKDGEKVKVDPETFKILGGKLYLFYNFWGKNTLEDWNDDEAQLKSTADKQWKKYVNP